MPTNITENAVPTQPPVPFYPGNRLIGIELEFDAGSTELRMPPRTPRGWARKSDGSLSNGVEMVLEPPLTYEESVPVTREFCRAFNEARTNTCKNGGYHVHVQAADYDTHKAHKLVKLYTKYKSVINRLLAESRHMNHFCRTYDDNITHDQLVNMFSLNRPARNRMEAKGSRQYSAVNCAMLRCDVADERSVEFRQGSVTKRFECVMGWAALMVALTDMPNYAAVYTRAMRGSSSLEHFVEALRELEAATGAQDVANWVLWRDSYMNAEPTDEQIDAAVQKIGRRSHGIFFVSRELDVNLAVAKRILAKASEQGKLIARGTKFRAARANLTEGELEMLEEAYIARINNTAPPPSEDEDETEEEVVPTQVAINPAPAPAALDSNEAALEALINLGRHRASSTRINPDEEV